MRKSFILFIILVCALGFFCLNEPRWGGKKEQKNGVVYMHNTADGIWNNKTLDMTKIFTIGLEKDFILAEPVDVITDFSNNIYIADAKDCCIKIFNSEGVFIKQIGKKGLGPGEFSKEIEAIEFIPTDKLCVKEDNGLQKKISIFHVNGKFISNYIVEGMKVSDIASHSNGEHLFYTRSMPPLMLLGKMNHEYKYEVYKYDLIGNLLNKFCELEGGGMISNTRHYSFRGFISRDKNNDLIIAFQYPYIIKKFTQNGFHKLTITKDWNIFVEPTLISKEIIPGRKMNMFLERSSISNLLLFPDGKIMVKITDRGSEYLDDKNNYLKISYDLYDQSGRFLQNFEWQGEPGETLHFIDHNGHAYTISKEEIPKVTKYLINFGNI